ncbi:MAG: methionine adenosyltransferase [Candidatus Aminicenantes bacterium]|nr:methionine adenosyltransferase [Candidatus Aminicenantes bacterium]
MAKKYFFTSESVTEGHPDKICDQISDAILDEMLSKDPESRVAVECLVTTGSVHVAGEVTTNAYVDIQQIVRDTLRIIGYTDPEFGIDYLDAGVWMSIHGQSPDIARGVNGAQEKEQGAGDQGMMFGFACRETPELMPFPIIMAHRLCMKLAEVRKRGIVAKLGPDGKSQVTVEYEDGQPKRIDAVVIAQQHLVSLEEETLRREIIEKVIKPVCGQYLDDKTNYHINATGKFVIGGPEGDTGVTGRKIIVDTYGGMGRHGGGSFSGKDPSKVDRSAAYACRYIAKNIVAAGLADRCEVQVSYAIGLAEPENVYVETFGTGRISEERIIELIREHFPLRPAEIIRHLRLKRPIFRKTAAYGHFGRSDPDFTWELTDKADLLRRALK